MFGRLEITVPSALLVGDADYPPLVEANKQAAAEIPGCAFTLVPGMGPFPAAGRNRTWSWRRSRRPWTARAGDRGHSVAQDQERTVR